MRGSVNMGWYFRWRRKLFTWELVMIQYLIGGIGKASFRIWRSDCIV